MKNKLLSLLVVVLLGVLPVVSFAETTGPGNNPETKGKVEQKINTIKDNLEARKDAVKNSVQERRQNVVDKILERTNQFIQNVIERFEAVVNRFDVLVQRIESRIAKIESRNIDESRAKELLAAAKVKIETAKSSIAFIAVIPATSVASTTASTTASMIKEAFKNVKTQIEKAKKDLRDAHAALVDVVNNLKPGDNKLRNSPAATSTATTTDTDD